MGIRRERSGEMEALLNRSAIWAVTYGDLMSYLMIFFLLMFGLSLGGQGKFSNTLSSIETSFAGQRPDSPAVKRAAMRELEASAAKQLEDKLHARGVEDFATVSVEPQFIRVTFKEGVLFDSGQAVLRDQAREVLKTFAETMKGLSNRVVVEGHTDSQAVRGGRYRTNMELSMARAHGVISYMADEAGIERERLSGLGYGEFKPVGDNATPEGRAANRRIEMLIVRTD